MRIMTTKTENAGRCSARKRVACPGDRNSLHAVVVFMQGLSSRATATMPRENSNERGCFPVVASERGVRRAREPSRVICATARPITQGRQRRAALAKREAEDEDAAAGAET